MADIKIFVCCHQKGQHVPEHNLLYPIQVGTALSRERFDGFLYDDTGENISILNRSYCELTAQYWAWKNIRADYYGFFHYRRYLYPNVAAKHPYRIEGELSEQLLTQLGYNDFGPQIEAYDCIVPKGENMYLSVRDHYATAPFHHGRDLCLIEEIILQNYPDYGEAMERYFSGSICYFGNIYIMKHTVFHEYCAWLFSILAKFDQQADCSGYGTQERRVDGYLAERLLGVFVAYQSERLRILELPRLHIVPAFKDRLSKKAVALLLPPGSRRRSIVKKMKR